VQAPWGRPRFFLTVPRVACTLLTEPHTEHSGCLSHKVHNIHCLRHFLIRNCSDRTIARSAERAPQRTTPRLTSARPARRPRPRLARRRAGPVATSGASDPRVPRYSSHACLEPWLSSCRAVEAPSSCCRGLACRACRGLSRLTPCACASRSVELSRSCRALSSFCRVILCRGCRVISVECAVKLEPGM